MCALTVACASLVLEQIQVMRRQSKREDWGKERKKRELE